MPVKILGTDPADLEGELSALEGLIRGSGHVFLVDSYAVTDAYLQALHRFGRVYLLDDMQQHAFPVDGVINYNLFASREKYRELYGSSTGQYLGAAYVPVRQQFCEAAAQYILQDDVTDILITTGGGDKDNIAGEILRELCVLHNLPKLCTALRFRGMGSWNRTVFSALSAICCGAAMLEFAL